jgi:ubiquitin-activating enzyme E1
LHAWHTMPWVSTRVTRSRALCNPAAKNVILAGVRALTIHDREPVALPDLGAAFYLGEADVGANRAEACREKLAELNTSVEVTASSAELTPDFLSKFQVAHLGAL